MKNRVLTVTSDAASMFSRSLTFSTASKSVGSHTPAAQLMFCVGSLDIMIFPCGFAAHADDELHNAARVAASQARCVLIFVSLVLIAAGWRADTDSRC